jgi:CheY-like chemotaxis protein
LAGGVAHDFNNLLTVILGNAALVDAALATGDPRREEIDQIKIAAERAERLTRQLLAFARKQVIAPVPLDLSEVVRGTQKLLQRVLGEDVRLVTQLAPGLPAVRADPGQLEQVIMNLAVNARDAMPRGGTLTIETRGGPGCAAAVDGAAAGPWVQLLVRDSGTGMSEEVKAHLFEPFFTTKRPGQGTGLGLATVHGAVGQAGGHVHVESEVGRGTAVTVCLPVTADAAVRAEQPAAGSARGREAVLVVEDDAQVRRVTMRTLERAGYRVVGAGDAAEALDRFREGAVAFDLVVTDVIMPGLSGRALVAELERLRPGIRALYVSGYTRDALASRDVADEGIHFLPKPFTPATLLDRVREVLAAAR